MRRADRAVTDRERILQVIESCECCRVGFSCPEGAYIVPLNFAFVPGTPDRFYFHGAQEGRKADLIRTAPRVGFELATVGENHITLFIHKCFIIELYVLSTE